MRRIADARCIEAFVRSVNGGPPATQLTDDVCPAACRLSTPVENLTVPPLENLTDRRRGDEPQVPGGVVDKVVIPPLNGLLQRRRRPSGGLKPPI
jgi:hypothetical protein